MFGINKTLGGLLAAAALIASVPAAQAQNQIKIGAIVPSSGPFAEWGRSNTVTLKMLEKQINDAGGINGAKLDLVILDDGAKPAQSANDLRKLAGDEKVLAVAGPLTSSACEVTFPIANQLKIVATSQASSKPGVAAANRPWAFRNTIDEGILAKTSVPYFKKTFNVKSVALIYDAKDAVSTAIATKIMPKVFADNGIKVLNEKDAVSFNTGDLDVSAQVTKLKSLNPDGVVIGADYSQAITVLREMNRQGMDKPVIGGTPLISSAILKAAPKIPVIAPATFYATMKTPKAEKFVSELQPLLRKTSGLPKDIEPSMYDANIYEIVSMYVDAVKKAGITGDPKNLEADRVKIRDYMTNLKGYEGFSGPIHFGPSGDAVKNFFIVQGQNGAWETKVKGCSATGGNC
ncbi:MAG TPA: ABC transporter substrate-binding protein [Pseudolabrys sp.]|jgi:branched-chain amino acid transport system substrate-binding protein|nr:ABC transporter substrate-binding protein [Pseudolabrys sp.]